MFKHLVSGNEYIFTRKKTNTANIETFRATFQDIVNSTLRVTNVYDQSMNLLCCMRTMPIEWIIRICPLDNQSVSSEVDDDIETIILDNIKPNNKNLSRRKIDAFY